MENDNEDPITKIPKDEFNKLCSQMISEVTGVNIRDNIDYDDPAVEYINPDINNKNRRMLNKNLTKDKTNTFYLLK